MLMGVTHHGRTDTSRVNGRDLRPCPSTEGAVSPQMLPEKAGGTIPRQFGRLAVVHRHALLIDESVVGIVAEQFERFAGRLHRLLEAIDQLRGAPVLAG